MEHPVQLLAVHTAPDRILKAPRYFTRHLTVPKQTLKSTMLSFAGPYFPTTNVCSIFIKPLPLMVQMHGSQGNRDEKEGEMGI